MCGVCVRAHKCNLFGYCVMKGCVGDVSGCVCGVKFISFKIKCNLSILGYMLISLFYGVYFVISL